MRCCECKLDLPEINFARNRCTKSGYNSICKGCKRTRDQKHYTKNRDKIIEHNKKYNQDNKEWFYAYCREFNRSPEATAKRRLWFRQHPDYIKEWVKKNPDKVLNVRHMRRAAKNGGPRDFIPLNDLFLRDRGTCQICGQECLRKDASMDHVKPLSKGGFHTWDNVQLAHLKCNKIKGNREWLKLICN